jgi:hypothetical protein
MSKSGLRIEKDRLGSAWTTKKSSYFCPTANLDLKNAM